MYQIGMIGQFTNIGPLLESVYKSDYHKLQDLIDSGANLNEPIKLDEYSSLYPLELAVFTNNLKMCRYLQEHGADNNLYHEAPLLLSAIRYGSDELIAEFLPLSYKLSPEQKSRAYMEVYWANRPDIIDLLELNNIRVAQYGGQAFRSAVAFNKTTMIKSLLFKGVDVNYHKSDMGFPHASTPIIEAAANNNFSLVKLLVDHGADITITDKYGDRPYSLAIKNKNHEMAEYLKALEPQDWHNEQEQLKLFKKYHVPKKIIEYLKTGPLRLEFPHEEHIKYLELLPFLEVGEFKYRRYKFLSLLASMDNYSDYLLLFSPTDKRLWYFDLEHEELAPLVKWDEFIKNPGAIINNMLMGEYAPHEEA